MINNVFPEGEVMNYDHRPGMSSFYSRVSFKKMTTLVITVPLKDYSNNEHHLNPSCEWKQSACIKRQH